MNGFTAKSLQEIQNALDMTPQNNPHFHVSISETCLKASFGYGESAQIRFSEGKYIRTRHLERSTIVDECADEAQAMAWFIQHASLGKRSF